MEIRDFFTEDEIKKMQEKIIEQTVSYAFLMDKEGSNEDGPYKIKVLQNQINCAVREETNKLIKDYVKEVINTKVKEQVAKAVENFTQKLVDQLDKITEKTNWYWSIK